MGQALLCRHPVCNHLHPATVLTCGDQDTLLVKFHSKELGSQSVKDYQVILNAQPCALASQEDLFNYELVFNRNEGE